MQAMFGDCLVPRRYWEDFELGDWSYRIRVALRDKVLKQRHFEELDKMGFPWVVPVVWPFLLLSLLVC